MFNTIKKQLLIGFKGTLEYYFNPQAHLFLGYYFVVILSVPLAIFCNLWLGVCTVVGIPFVMNAFLFSQDMDFTVYDNLENKVVAIYKKIF